MTQKDFEKNIRLKREVRELTRQRPVFGSRKWIKANKLLVKLKEKMKLEDENYILGQIVNLLKNI